MPVTLFLSGCFDSEEKQEVTVSITTPATEKDVNYFLQHKDELKQTLKECSNNPADFQNNPICTNAKAALSKSFVEN